MEIRVKEFNLKVEINYQEFDTFQLEVGIKKAYLKHRLKMLDFNTKSTNIKPKSSGKNNLTQNSEQLNQNLSNLNWKLRFQK